MAKSLEERFGGLGIKVSDEDLKGLSWTEKLRLKEQGKLTEAQERQHGFYPQQNGGPHEPPKGAKLEEPTVASESEDEGYAGWTKVELQAEIDNRNEMRDEEDHLPRTGNKDDLIAVLEEDDEAEDE